MLVATALSFLQRLRGPKAACIEICDVLEVSIHPGFCSVNVIPKCQVLHLKGERPVNLSGPRLLTGRALIMVSEQILQCGTNTPPYLHRLSADALAARFHEWQEVQRDALVLGR